MTPQRLENDYFRPAALHAADSGSPAVCLWWQEGSSVLLLPSSSKGPNAVCLAFVHFPLGVPMPWPAPLGCSFSTQLGPGEGKHEAEAHQSLLVQELPGTSLDMPLPSHLGSLFSPIEWRRHESISLHRITTAQVENTLLEFLLLVLLSLLCSIRWYSLPATFL